MSVLSYAALVLFCVAGCSSTPSRTYTPEPIEDTTPLWPAGRWSGDRMLQQHLTARWGHGETAGEQGFDSVVQKVGDELTVLGLSPIGQVGFVIRLVQDELTFENHSDRELPFPPRLVLLDVQRVFYPWFDGAPSASELRVGERSGFVDTELVRETFVDERCIERRFTLRDDPEAGPIIVRYEWDSELSQAPRTATLDNRRHGYRLLIETHAETLLGDAP